MTVSFFLKRNKNRKKAIRDALTYGLSIIVIYLAMNLGMNTIVLDVNQGAWKLETERGVVMDGDKPEHLLEAVPVMGCYCDVIGVRSFAKFENKVDDYNEKILSQFIQYSGRPVFSMEAATRHPLQSFADLITIEEYKKTERPKVVLSWAPHPKSLPQAVPNSFAEWMNATDYEFVITQPKGYELDPKFVGHAHDVAFFDAVAQRFLAVDVFSSFASRGQQQAMPMVRCTNNNNIDIFIIDQFTPIFVQILNFFTCDLLSFCRTIVQYGFIYIT